jgi:hypothetical protein
VRGATVSFLEVGEHGDRLVLKAGRAPAFARWSMDPFGARP